MIFSCEFKSFMFKIVSLSICWLMRLLVVFFCFINKLNAIFYETTSIKTIFIIGWHFFFVVGHSLQAIILLPTCKRLLHANTGTVVLLLSLLKFMLQFLCFLLFRILLTWLFMFATIISHPLYLEIKRVLYNWGCNPQNVKLFIILIFFLILHVHQIQNTFVDLYPKKKNTAFWNRGTLHAWESIFVCGEKNKLYNV